MSGSIAQLSPTHATVDTSVLINATATDVWATLTDFDNMASWSTGTLKGVIGTSKMAAATTTMSIALKPVVIRLFSSSQTKLSTTPILRTS